MEGRERMKLNGEREKKAGGNPVPPHIYIVWYTYKTYMRQYTEEAIKSGKVSLSHPVPALCYER